MGDDVIVTGVTTNSDGSAHAQECTSNTAFQINIDTVFNSIINFGIFKDGLCGMHNIKVSGVLKVHTSVGGSTISGLVSSISGNTNNITSSLIIAHTGSYLDRCSHIASNVFATDGL